MRRLASDSHQPSALSKQGTPNRPRHSFYAGIIAHSNPFVKGFLRKNTFFLQKTIDGKGLYKPEELCYNRNEPFIKQQKEKHHGRIHFPL